MLSIEEAQLLPSLPQLAEICEPVALAVISERKRRNGIGSNDSTRVNKRQDQVNLSRLHFRNSSSLRPLWDLGTGIWWYVWSLLLLYQFFDSVIRLIGSSTHDWI